MKRYLHLWRDALFADGWQDRLVARLLILGTHAIVVTALVLAFALCLWVAR